MSADELLPIEDGSDLVLGRGKFGYVVKLNQCTALKIIICKDVHSIDESIRIFEDAKMEIIALSTMSPHQNIVRYMKSTVCDEEMPKVTIKIELELLTGSTILELFNNGTIQRSSGASRIDILAQIHAGLLHIHSHGFVHMDISPNNVMIENNGRVVIIDLGFVKFSDHERRCDYSKPANEESKPKILLSSKRGGLGTLGYMAPENGNNPHWFVSIILKYFVFNYLQPSLLYVQDKRVI